MYSYGSRNSAKNASVKGANLLLKVGGTKLKVHVEGAMIKAHKLSRLGGKRCELR